MRKRLHPKSCMALGRPLRPDELPEDSGVPEPIRAAHSEFWRCGQCRKIYWTGQMYRRARGHLAARLCAVAAPVPRAAGAALL